MRPRQGPKGFVPHSQYVWWRSASVRGRPRSDVSQRGPYRSDRATATPTSRCTASLLSIAVSRSTQADCTSHGYYHSSSGTVAQPPMKTSPFGLKSRERSISLQPQGRRPNPLSPRSQRRLDRLSKWDSSTWATCPPWHPSRSSTRRSAPDRAHWWCFHRSRRVLSTAAPVASSNCTLSYPRHQSGTWQFIWVPTPADLQLHRLRFHQCWVRLRYLYESGSAPTDVTSWTVSIDGNPVRLVQRYGGEGAPHRCLHPT